MPKRKLELLARDEDNASTPSTSNIRDRLRKRESTHPDLVPLDNAGDVIPDQKPNTSTGVMLLNLENSVVEQSLDNCTITEEYRVNAGIPTKNVARMPVSKTARFYKMDHRKRGVCLVFNQENFDSKLSKRKGSEFDVSRIKTTFGRLNFDVTVCPDLKHSELMDEIRKLSSPEITEHGDSDCVCIFILTHGLSNDFLMAKDAGYILDAICKPFTADKCPTLAGKPKLFFIQACRGDNLDEAVTLEEHYACSDETDSPSTSYTIPSHSDFLIAQSCQNGFSAVRNTERGSWYVQCLCDVLDEFAESTDLLKMLTLTAQRVATDFTWCGKEDGTQTTIVRKQIPSVRSTLTRDIYFFQRPEDNHQDKINMSRNKKA